VSAAYIRLAELAERERDLALAGQVDEVLAVQAERTALIAGLPAAAPAEAQPYLRRAFAAQAETTAALGRGLRSVREEAVRLEHGRGAVAAYLPSAPRVARVAATG
jgi:hypothetical protein